MGCMADYDEDCKGIKPKGCMCQKCCEERFNNAEKKMGKLKPFIGVGLIK